LAAAQPGLRAHVAALMGSRCGADREDVVQETLSRALAHRHAHDGERALLPWLKGIALRVYLDLLEGERRRPRPLEGHEEPCARRSPDPVALAEEVARLLERLAPTERAVLERFHRQGESIRGIAHALDLPEGTVKSHLHRARRRLAGEERR